AEPEQVGDTRCPPQGNGRDLVFKLCFEIRHVEDQPSSPHSEFHASVPPEALFRDQIWIGCEECRDRSELLEETWCLKARADAGVRLEPYARAHRRHLPCHRSPPTREIREGAVVVVTDASSDVELPREGGTPLPCEGGPVSRSA